MDLKGSLVDTKLKIIPSESLLQYVQTISSDKGVPANFLKVTKTEHSKAINKNDLEKRSIELTNEDIDILNNITNSLSNIVITSKTKSQKQKKPLTDIEKDKTLDEDSPAKNASKTSLDEKINFEVSDLEWLYLYIEEERKKNKEVPYLHALLEGSQIELPENKVLKRNPDLEARCVKLRAQQESRDYRKMTKTVDNVRMTFPEDSISYQLKQINRQLIAIGQFIISIFAGFLFGFRGVEWMVGNLEFGFRLLLGVMCALVIALAEIYFLAKKLNEEMQMTETVQIGGPPKFSNDTHKPVTDSADICQKEHQE